MQPNITFFEHGVPYYPTVEEINKVGNTTYIQDNVINKIINQPLVRYKTGRIKGNIESFNVNNLLLNAIENYRIVKEDVYIDMTEYIMLTLGNSFIQKVANVMGITSTSFVDIYNLLWYINMRDETIIGKIRLNKEEVQWVTNLTNESLYNLVNIQGNYDGSFFRAPLLFTALYGAIIPKFRVTERYDIVKDYPPNIVWILADKVYNISDDDNNILPPYYYVASKDLSPVETIIINIKEDNVDVLARQYGVVFPIGIISPSNKVKYMLKEIARYGPILIRSPNLVPPSKISPVLSTAIKQLEQYTSQEIVNTYWIDGGWNDYRSLVRHIKDIKKEGSKWSIGHQSKCTNDQQNISRGNASYTQRIRDKQTGLEDPVLSYGVYDNYFCYRVSELITAWEKSNIGPFVPYWTKDLLDPATNLPMTNMFSDDSIQQLKNVISNKDQKQYGILLNIIHKFIH